MSTIALVRRSVRLSRPQKPRMREIEATGSVVNPNVTLMRSFRSNAQNHSGAEMARPRLRMNYQRPASKLNTAQSGQGTSPSRQLQRDSPLFALGVTILVGSSLPGGVDRLAHQERGIRARTRSELLHSAARNFGNIEIALLVHACTVHVEQGPRIIAQSAPGIE